MAESAPAPEPAANAAMAAPAFIDIYNLHARLFMRWAALAALAAWLSLLLLIAWIAPESAIQATFLVATTIVPCLLLLLWSTRGLRWLRYHQPLGAFSILVAYVVVARISVYLPAAAAFRTAGSLVLTFYAIVPMRLRFGYAALATGIGTAFSQAYLVLHAPATGGKLAVFSFLLWLTECLALYAAYMLEAFSRRMFAQNRLMIERHDSLRRYFSRDVIDQIFAGQLDAKPGGSYADATVMFVDVRDSTPIAELLGPQLFARFMSNILERITDIVFEHKGTVIRTTGDGVLATFGVPRSHGQDALNSVSAAQAITEYFKTYNEREEKLLEQPVRSGIGIATGRIFAGNLGSGKRLEYNVLGEAVNRAARLQEQTRDAGSDILIDEGTRSALGLDSVLGPERSFQLRGLAEQTTAWPVVGPIKP
ncbi:MAG: adenylate/guanylate cyclase domain-containing protein [Spirochaetales bacterium]|nr:adenylate/guanylate cyclase domain-containing protein [Leptospiraceae bacterium]MCP5482527.1 adenylate/guanylate cyclase domain-containing protein [Spirochaetales bacterium]MCP5485117.1 adenylate/guanylate cyclase domain-containing protein [Spirochaetales bacterium]